MQYLLMKLIAFEAAVLIPLVLTKNEGMMDLAAVPNQLGSSIYSQLWIKSGDVLDVNDDIFSMFDDKARAAVASLKLSWITN